jgi:hypothetical protein
MLVQAFHAGQKPADPKVPALHRWIKTACQYLLQLKEPSIALPTL